VTEPLIDEATSHRVYSNCSFLKESRTTQIDQSNRRNGSTFQHLAPSESANEKMVSLNFASWNRVVSWLRQLESFERPLDAG
jgi:hypothetical protein